MYDRTDLWQVPPNRLRWQCWDDEFIVYNVASGQTHYLNNLAKDVLKYFEDEPGTISGLISDIQIGDNIPSPISAPFCDQICALIQEFDSLGLIARVIK